MSESTRSRSTSASTARRNRRPNGPRAVADLRPVPSGTDAGAKESSPDEIARSISRDAARENALDRAIHANMAKMTGGISPSALWEAHADWALHLATAPGKQMQLATAALQNAQKLANYATQCALTGPHPEPCTMILPQDRRFVDDGWKRWPFNVMSQAFLLNQSWWGQVTQEVRGVTKPHENLVTFLTRQALDVYSPSNFLPTNPEVLEATLQSGGQNLMRGAENLLQDIARQIKGLPEDELAPYIVGETLAVSPGQVVYRNRLIELIQYAPTTDKVHPEPILIVPAWIMKYYILDLSPQNSLVKYLTDQGFTVFMISWKNPDASDRDLGLEDYHTLGVMAALDAVGKIAGDRKVHGVGYCLGGTLLAIAASAMARDADARFGDLSFFAAQTDFTEAGELTLFVNESQITFLEDMMSQRGYLDASQMAGTFQMLRSNDLIWSRAIRHYLLGQPMVMSDMMAWNADATRMPARMHSEYLRQLFLNNDFAEGRFKVGGLPVALSDIRIPILAVGTEWDHVAPWTSVYKFHLFADTDVTFILTNGGHNAGIVSEIGHPDRHYRMATKRESDMSRDAQTWLAKTPVQDGSWWPALTAWLADRSGAKAAPPPMGNAKAGLAPLCAAPGTYVMEK